MEKIREFIENNKIIYRELATYTDISYSLLQRHVKGRLKDQSGKIKEKILLALDKYISDQRMKAAIMRAQFSTIYNEEHPPEQ